MLLILKAPPASLALLPSHLASPPRRQGEHSATCSSCRFSPNSLSPLHTVSPLHPHPSCVPCTLLYLPLPSAALTTDLFLTEDVFKCRPAMNPSFGQERTGSFVKLRQLPHGERLQILYRSLFCFLPSGVSPGPHKWLQNKNMG